MATIRARKVVLKGYKLVVFDEPDDCGDPVPPMVIDDERAKNWPEPGFWKSHLQPLHYYVHAESKNWDRRKRAVASL